MTNREWLSKYMNVTDMNDVFNYTMGQCFCLSAWYDGHPDNCPICR